METLNFSSAANELKALQAIKLVKWGVMAAPDINGAKTKGERFTKPKFARFRMKVQYKEASAYYYSYDYIPKFNKGVKIGKERNEQRALSKLIEMMNKRAPDSYRYAVIYCNVSNDLSTDSVKFDLHLCNILRTGIVWKLLPAWRADNPTMLDIPAMREKLQTQLKK
jgi:hypothetical protein